MAVMTTKATPKKAATKTAVAGAKPAAKKPVIAAAKAKPAVKKPAAKAVVASTKPTARKPAASKASAPKSVAKTTTNKPMTVSDEQRYRMVAEAAYYRAESNQFKSDPVRDWIDAESDISALLSGAK